MLPLQTNYLWVNKLQHPQIKPHLQQLPMFSDGMSDHIVSEVQKTCLCGNWYKCNSHWPTHFSSPNMRVCISQTATPSRAVRLGPTTPMGTGFGQRPKKKNQCQAFVSPLKKYYWVVGEASQQGGKEVAIIPTMRQRSSWLPRKASSGTMRRCDLCSSAQLITMIPS